MGFKTLGINAAVATAVVAGSAMAISPAQALTLNGSITLNGNATQTDVTTIGSNSTVTFANPTSVSGIGDFAGITAGGITISPLILQLTSQSPLVPGVLNQSFLGSAASPFINFGTRTIGALTSNLSFVLDPGTFNGTRIAGGPTLFRNGLITGNFVFGGNTFGVGFLNVSGTPSSSTYSVSLTGAQPIPTPALLPGLIGLGVAAFRRRKTEVAEEVS